MSKQQGCENAPLLDAILVINPRDFTERRQSIERQLQPLGLPYEFIHTFDAGDLFFGAAVAEDAAR